MTRGIAALIATVAVGAPACQREVQSPPPVGTAEPERRKDGPFESPYDLMKAIESGDFVERVGLGDEIAAATRPPAPSPVKIEFVSGTRVPDDQEDELRQLADRLKADERLQVDLTGCSDPLGEAALNQRISESRARSVASRLRELGVGDAQIGEVVGRGEECPVKERAVNAVSSYRREESERTDGGAGEAPAEG